MQNVCKREQKGSKDAKAKNPTAKNMSTGWNGLWETCRQVGRGVAAARSTKAMRAGCTVHSASTSRLDHATSRLDHTTCRLDEIAVEKPVDWNEHVDRLEYK